MSPEKIDLVRQAIKARIEKGTKLTRGVLGVAVKDGGYVPEPKYDGCACAAGCVILESGYKKSPTRFEDSSTVLQHILGATSWQVRSLVGGFDGKPEAYCGETTDPAWHAAGKALFEEFAAQGLVSA